MKKLFTLLALAAQIFTASAASYTDSLQVQVVGGESTVQQATINLDRQADGRYTLALRNFIISIGDQQMGIGNIELTDVAATTEGETLTLVADQTIAIQPGDGESPTGMWVGPAMLGEVPVKLVAEQRGEQLYAVIDIDMQATLKQTIKVVFGHGGYTMPNGGFEQFHTATLTSSSGRVATSDEPNHWHSFMSASGDATLAWLAGSTPHTFISQETRPGSTGRHSVLLTSTQILFITANGTMTTGRVNTGSMIADNVSNHAWLDMDNTDTDANGDPFYTELNGRPDTLVVWVKFKQKKTNAQYPYATVSAAITDGTYYQEPAPAGKTYANVLARAKNNTIASNGFEWQRLAIPFETVDADIKPRALFVTISTNATPGKGSTDSLYVDDMQLVYNQDISVKGISVKGQTLDVADQMSCNLPSATVLTEEDIIVDTPAARVFKRMETTDAGVRAYVTVASGDLKTFKTYTITANGAATGIDRVSHADDASAIYNLQGQRVNSMEHGKVYIVKKGGKTYKVKG